MRTQHTQTPQWEPESQGCGESSKYIPQSKWKPQNPDIILPWGAARLWGPQASGSKQNLPSTQQTQACTGTAIQDPLWSNCRQGMPGQPRVVGTVEVLFSALSTLPTSLPLPSLQQCRATPPHNKRQNAAAQAQSRARTDKTIWVVGGDTPGHRHTECQASRATAKAEAHTSNTLPEPCVLPAIQGSLRTLRHAYTLTGWPHMLMRGMNLKPLPLLLDLPTVIWTRRYWWRKPGRAARGIGDRGRGPSSPACFHKA